MGCLLLLLVLLFAIVFRYIVCSTILFSYLLSIRFLSSFFLSVQQQQKERDSFRVKTLTISKVFQKLQQLPAHLLKKRIPHCC